jgi:hypothetical protein
MLGTRCSLIKIKTRVGKILKLAPDRVRLSFHQLGYRVEV